MKFKNKKYIRRVLMLVVIIGAVYSLVRYLYQVKPTFPNISAGIYTGYISGLDIKHYDYVPVLFERPSEDRLSVTVVPFLEGFEAQQVELKATGPLIEGVSLSDAVSYEPIELKHAGTTFKLYGKDKKDRVRGKVLVLDKKASKGAWKIYPQAEEVISQKDIELLVDDFDLPTWLKAKSEYRFLEETIDSLNSVTQEQEKSIQKLEAHIGDQQELKKRASEQRERISKEITTAKREQADLEKEVSSSAEQLTLLSRITKRGQVVGLARRTSGREAKWYLANWQTKDESGMDEALGANLNIDFQKLSEASRQAQEIHALKQEIIREREKIQELRERSVVKESGETQKGIKPRSKEAPKKEEQGFWDKVFGL